MEGEHKIVLVQSFEWFPDVHPYSQFKLTISSVISPALKSKTPPSFSPSLPDNLTVKQCQNSSVETWIFSIPPTFDPNNSPVTVLVKLDTKFFAVDYAARTIT